MLERMQSADGSLPESLRDEHGADQTDRLKSALAKAEAELAGIKAGENSGAAIRSALESQTRELEMRLAEQASELTRLKASLKAYEDAAQAFESGQESPIPAMAELNALQAEAEEQRRAIQVLRAEVANSNDRLARQATHFRDELRRLGSASATAPSQAMRTVSEAPRRSLAERIAQPRIPAKLEPVETESSETPAPGNGTPVPGNGDGRQSGFLRALNGGAGHSESSGAATDESAPQQPASGTSEQAAAEATPRRPRLLERISSIDKS